MSTAPLPPADPATATLRPVDPRTPCLIGVATASWRDSAGAAPEPLDMWEAVARRAAEDTGSSAVLGRIDALYQVHCMSWEYDDGPGRLAERLGATPSHRRVSMLAGTAGQRMVNDAAERMLRGESELALVVGAEALATVRRLRAAGESPAWSHPGTGTQPGLDLAEWYWPSEWAHDVIRPTVTFALLDTARRARTGAVPEAHRRTAAQLIARASEAATANPTSWFPTVRTVEEVATPGPDNRMVCTPYTKLMMAIMDVDMAAAVVVATHGAAERLGVPADRRVYLRGWGFGRDAVHVAERPALDRSPAMERVAADVLHRAGLQVDDIDVFDLYSCFPSSVLFALDALGMTPDDPRQLTAAGGLACHGGPGSNYTTHGIAALVGTLRSGEGSTALLSGVGMHMTKHVWAAYASEPGPVIPPDYDGLQAVVDAVPPVPVGTRVESGVGAVVRCGTVTHGYDGAPGSALVVAETGDGVRWYARSSHPDDLDAVGGDEVVGRPVVLRPGPEGTNAFAIVG